MSRQLTHSRITGKHSTKDAPQRSSVEEFANATTHAGGFILSVAGAAMILPPARLLERGSAVACIVFAATLSALYAVSTMSHVVQRSALQNKLRAWDQGVIYLVIAGTYTPFMWASLLSPSRELYVGLLWAAAVTGFGAKVVFGHRVNAITTHSYILMGWLPALTMIRVAPLPVLAWMAGGGVCYTVGTLFLKWDERFRYFHAIWHLFVIAGSACHFWAIYWYIVVPRDVTLLRTSKLLPEP